MHLMKFSSNFWLLFCSIYFCSGQENATEESGDIPDFGLLDIRVGKILDAKHHPRADLLFVETVHFGEHIPKTIVSSLVSHFNEMDLFEKLTLFVVNFKPTKLRGIESEGMILCVSDGQKVEYLVPPNGSEPGDVVLVEGYDYKPEPKGASKVYDKIEPYLRVNENGVVTFNNIPWNVSGKGYVTTSTIKNVSFDFKPTTQDFNITRSTFGPFDANVSTFASNTVFFVHEK